MAWEIKFDESAKKDLARLDSIVAGRITRFLRQRVGSLDNPRDIGAALQGPSLGDLWKYRVGDYRVIARIEDKILRIMVVKIGNRSMVYR